MISVLATIGKGSEALAADFRDEPEGDGRKEQDSREFHVETPNFA
jgi:hypothetical protein